MTKAYFQLFSSQSKTINVHLLISWASIRPRIKLRMQCRRKSPLININAGLLVMKAAWNSSSHSHACMDVFTRITCVCRDNDGLSVQDEITQLLDSGRSKTPPNQHLTGLRSTVRSGWRSQDSAIDIILTAWMNSSWSCLMFLLCVLSPVYTSALPKWGCRLLPCRNFKFCSLVKNRTWLKRPIK